MLGSLIAPEHDVVVFDLGTNDDPAAPEALAADLAAAREIAGDRCLVVATLNRPPLNGVPVDGLNRAVTSFAARTPNVSLVDWHAAAAADPGLLIDGVHSDADGYALRAGLFADAIASCSSFGGALGTRLRPRSSPSPATLPPAASAGRNDRQRAAAPDAGPRRGRRRRAAGSRRSRPSSPARSPPAPTSAERAPGAAPRSALRPPSPSAVVPARPARPTRSRA